MELSRSPSEHSQQQSPTLADKVATVREMLARLDTVTIAGQRHLMGKVVAVVDSQAERAIHHAEPGRGRAWLDDLAFLRHESDRQLPSVPAFGARADSLLSLLSMGA